MAASPDDLADGEPFTPSAFLDLPPTPARSPGDDDDPAALPADLVLPVISRMLMEDTDEEDELLLNHPSLLQAQRPFAQILSGAATTPSPPQASDPAAAFAGATWPYDPEELSGRLLLLSRTRPPGDHHGGALASDFFSSSGQNRVDMDMLNEAFLKGMEEASKFLPPTNDNNLLFHGEAAKTSLFQERGNNGKGEKKWHSWEWDDYVLEAETGRKSKITAPGPEETGEAVDKLIVDGYDACMEKMKGLRIARIAEAEKKLTKKKGNKSNGNSSNEAVDLRTLLICCAEAMSSITGIDLPRPGFRPAARVEETGRRLSKYARELGVPFQFHSVVAEWETARASDLRAEPDEVLVVNSITSLGNTMDEGADVDSPSPRDVVLGNIQKMHPDVFILCVVNGSYGGPLFLSRFREALSYYSAVFDMLHGTAPLDSSQRLAVERDLVGRRALNVIACEGSDRVERPEMYRQWQARNRRAGLRQLPLCPYIVKMLREKVTKYYHKEFVTDVDQQWLLQGWKGRILYAMSTWTADDTVS
ncbi:unnamed protein product [Urochloa decumbens]|uniref:Uncharacterized protein n=1 Tax=Urochloa decumbens TaxID=240449 RepID=A0ABC8YVH8_9POAL